MLTLIRRGWYTISVLSMLTQFKKNIMELKPIKSEKDYRNALVRLDIIFDAPIDTKDGDEAEILSLLIENY